MTRKKDLKKAKSKKKPRKNIPKDPYKKFEVQKEEVKLSPMEAVAKSKDIAKISLVQTTIMMLFSLALIFVKENSTGFWGKIYSFNTLLEKVLTREIIFCIEAALVICTMYFIYKTLVSKEVKKFYNVSILISAMALIYCMFDTHSTFIVYNIGLIVALLMGILQVTKVIYVNKILRG